MRCRSDYPLALRLPVGAIARVMPSAEPGAITRMSETRVLPVSARENGESAPPVARDNDERPVRGRRSLSVGLMCEQLRVGAMRVPMVRCKNVASTEFGRAHIGSWFRRQNIMPGRTSGRDNVKAS